MNLIKTFRNRETKRLFTTGTNVRLGDVSRRAFQKLRMLDAARTLGDLAILPGNRLEALKGDRRGQHSIRVNEQFRICFVWRDGDALDVEVADYH